MTLAEFQQIAPTLPLQPGIYQYYDAKGELLYVGKAKQIRKRVSSYFSKQPDNLKTAELVKRIAQIRFTIVEVVIATNGRLRTNFAITQTDFHRR